MIISRAPYTLSFFGEGTDTPAWYHRHGGSVLAAAINRYCCVRCDLLPVCAAPTLRLADFSRPDNLDHEAENWRQTLTAARRMLRVTRQAEADCRHDARFASGIGGASAQAVGLLHALHAAQGRRPSRRRLAAESVDFLCQQENERIQAGCPVTSAYGGINHIRFHPNDAFRVTPAAITPERARAFQSHLLLFAPDVRPSFGLSSQFGADSSASRGQMLQLTGFAEEAAALLESEQPLDAFGGLLHEAWRACQAACPHAYAGAMQTLYAEARGLGALGGKIAGAGRLLLLFAPPDAHAAIRQRLRGIDHIPFAFDFEGSRIVSTPPDADERTDPSLSFSPLAVNANHATRLYARAA